MLAAQACVLLTRCSSMHAVAAFGYGLVVPAALVVEIVDIAEAYAGQGLQRVPPACIGDEMSHRSSGAAGARQHVRQRLGERGRRRGGTDGRQDCVGVAHQRLQEDGDKPSELHSAGARSAARRVCLRWSNWWCQEQRCSELPHGAEERRRGDLAIVFDPAASLAL